MLKEFKFGLFDVFTYTLPGLFLLLSITILIDLEKSSIYEIMSGIKNNLNLSIGLATVVVAYVIGFANDSFGTYLRKNLGKRLIRKPERKLPEITITEKYSLVREFSKENFKFVETWNALKGMSSNLSSASLFLFISCVIKMIVVFPEFIFQWIIISILSLILSYVFLERSVKYAAWAIGELDHAADLIINGKEKYGVEIKPKDE